MTQTEEPIVKLKTHLEYWMNRVVSELDPESVEIIKHFDHELEVVEYSETTRKDYLLTLHNFVSEVEKPISEINRDDMLNYLKSKKWKLSSQKTFWKRIKCFFNKYKPELDMELTFPKQTKEPDETPDWAEKLPTMEEIEAMIASCNNMRDQAIIVVMVESGARINEILRMTYKDVIMNDKYMRITLRGRKKTRDIPLIWGVKYVMQWLDQHPTKKADDPLWTQIYRGREGYLSYKGVSNVVKFAAKRAGIKKRIYPHLFRHLKSTLLAKDPTISTQVKKRFLGHARGSNTFEKVYEHMSDSDVIDSVLIGYGLKETEKGIEQAPLRAVYCPRCNKPVARIDKYCKHCYFTLDREAVKEEQNRMKDEILNDLIAVISKGDFQEELAKLITKRHREEQAKFDKQIPKEGEYEVLSPEETEKEIAKSKKLKWTK